MSILSSSVIYGLSITSLVLLVIWVICFVTGHLINRDMNPLIHAVSEYGAYQPSKPCIMGCWWSIAVVSILLDACLIYILNADPSGMQKSYLSSVICLATFAVARFLTSLFPTNVIQRPRYESVGITIDDEKNSELTPKLHNIFALCSFVSIVIAAISVGKAFAFDFWIGSVLDSNHSALYGLGFSCLGTIVPMTFARRIDFLKYYFGFFERLFYAAHIAFLFTLAATFVAFAEEI